MATLRRGLPRVSGGEPWPPAGEVEGADAVAAEAAADAPRAVERAEGETKRVEQAERVETAAPVAEEGFDSLAVAQPVSSPAAAPSSLNDPQGTAAVMALRRGLPRTPGGEPWPPEDVVGFDSHSRAERVETAAPVAASGTGEALRRGLPRTPGGDPWPPAGTASTPRVVERESEATETKRVERPEGAETSAPIPASTAVAAIDVSTPLPFQQTVFPGKNAFDHSAPVPEPTRIGPFTKGQWAGAVIVGGIGLLGAAAMAVLLVRWLLSFGALQDFVATYPGEYHLPEGAPVGFPGWLGWQHFFNVFLMVLIIRSGLRIRNEKRPTAFWTPRGNPKGKVSLTIWFHQSLDILWLVNGVVFVILLFVTGQWMRVIPTSWEVFPNAISAVLQYISLDWPTENGWVNYNSVQQIAYFTTIFLAAPLAAVTGFRMSGMWPKNSEKLSRAYPIEWARMLHFPVMLYFVVFIAIHVFLVFATGALRNLNHMYAAQGSVDPNAYADNWTGFWFLVASLVVIAAAWVAARPLVLAPIAKLFGTVSSR